MSYSYSLEGQDRIILSILRKVKKGFYIDIGSNDPVVNNDTYLLYKKGWSGVLVEPYNRFNILYKKKGPKI